MEDVVVNSRIVYVNKSLQEQRFFKMAASLALPGAIVAGFEVAGNAMDYMFRCNERPDVVILDMNIGDLSGKAFITLMKNSRPLEFIPLIGVGSYGMEQEILRYGADDFYCKPNVLGNLIELITKLKYKWLIDEQAILVGAEPNTFLN
jgi:FixJ family two-component response regulator